ncbi:hypothetical protein N9D71_00850 [bacterium]|nr:hypothetical protein [bacterium]
MTFLTRLNQRCDFKAQISEGADTLLLDYFFDRSVACEGEAKSKYWQSMPDYLSCAGLNPYFVHIFVPDSKVRTLRAAKRFNSQNAVPSLFIDQLLGPADYISAAGAMLSVFRIWLLNSKAASPNTNDYECMKSYREDELARSLFGTVGASHLLYNLAFHKLAEMSNRSGIRKLIYICEFQGWESLLIKNFRSQEITTIGYCHSTLRLLDLRGYVTESDFPTNLGSLRPDTLAVHSKRDRDLAKNRASKAEIAMVESTRYKDIPDRLIGSGSTGIEKILVVGGYSGAETSYLVAVCDELAAQDSHQLSFSFLSHPNATVFPANFPVLDRHLISEFTSVLSEYSVAVVAPETSGAMEAYLMGLPVITVARPGRLVASPVFGLPGVAVAQTSSELSKCFDAQTESPPNPQMYKLRPVVAHEGRFTLWSKLLKGRP